MLHVANRRPHDRQQLRCVIVAASKGVSVHVECIMSKSFQQPPDCRAMTLASLTKPMLLYILSLQCRKDASFWPVLSMIIKVATFPLTSPTSWVPELAQGIVSLANGGNPMLNFFGLNPVGTSPNPDTIFMCDCVVACQLMHLRAAPTPTDMARFAQCVGIPGNSQWPGITGQQAALQNYIKRVYNSNYLSFLKRYAATMNVRNARGEVLPPLERARQMLLNMDPATFTDQVLATPAFAKCSQLNTFLKGTVPDINAIAGK